MNRVTGTPGRDGDAPANDDLAEDRDDWMLTVDIREIEGHYLIRAELPGVAADDIELSVEHGMLLLTGERPRLWHTENRGPHRYRHFARSISLPFDALPDRFDAIRRDGVVEIRFAKDETAGPGTTEIAPA